MSIGAILLGNELFVIIGQGIIISTCILWWAWIMLLVYEIIEWHQKAVHHLDEIKTDLAEVKEILSQSTKEFHINDK
ncbi:MAG: hypothetical protein ABFD07_05240 [Methanobacterium sp.]